MKNRNGTGIGKKLIIIFAVLVLLFMFPQKVSAESVPAAERRVYYYDVNEEEAGRFVSYRLFFYGDITVEQQIEAVYANLFQNCIEELIPFVPHGTKLIGVNLDAGTLCINVSGGICGYGGGSAYEQGLVGQILKNAEQFEEIEKVTLLIEGRSTALPEGTLLLETDARAAGVE